MISANGSGLTRIVSRKGLSRVNCRIVRKDNLIPCLICENIYTYEYIYIYIYIYTYIATCNSRESPRETNSKSRHHAAVPIRVSHGRCRRELYRHVSHSENHLNKAYGLTKAMFAKTAQTPMSLGWQIQTRDKGQTNNYLGLTKAMFAKTAKTPMSLGWQMQKQMRTNT